MSFIQGSWCPVVHPSKLCHLHMTSQGGCSALWALGYLTSAFEGFQGLEPCKKFQKNPRTEQGEPIALHWMNRSGEAILDSVM